VKLLGLFLMVAAAPAFAGGDEVRVHMVVPGQQALQSLAADQGFGEPVDFVVEPLIADAPSNQARAQKEIWWYCTIDGQGPIPDCFITLSWEARANDAGHVHSHVGTRPKGRFSRTSGAVDSSDYYFKTTYYSSDVSGIVDVTAACNSCTDVDVTKIGVGITGFVELPAAASADSGYVLTGSDQYHPRNHYGQPEFVAAVQAAFNTYHDRTQLTIRANDISLPLGGLFDVQTASQVGYDWTRPHRYHRLGQSMDTSIPPSNSARLVYTQALSAGGVIPLHEDSHHWHLHLGGHL
jgi:hypothetical protein